MTHPLIQGILEAHGAPTEPVVTPEMVAAGNKVSRQFSEAGISPWQLQEIYVAMRALEPRYETSGESAKQPRISTIGLVWETCIDCDGAGRYPSGATCKSCEGNRIVPDYAQGQP